MYEKAKQIVATYSEGGYSVNYAVGYIDALLASNAITQAEFDCLSNTIHDLTNPS